jgi:hypothetical protein
MAIVQAGIAFRARTPIADLARLVADAHAADVTELRAPPPGRFDLRDPASAMLLLFGDAGFLVGDALARPLLDDPRADVARLHAALGAPAQWLAYEHDDDARRHGYAVVEHGRRTRTRQQVGDAAPAIDDGAPLACERRGDAPTALLLRDVLEALVGICPWETLITPGYRFFRLAPRAQPPVAAAAPAKRGWWPRR